MDFKSLFDKLEEDFYKRKAEEELKQKQDEVKMRVLGNPNVTYEQYSEMLKGAHLKPIKRENQAEITKGHKSEVKYTDYES